MTRTAHSIVDWLGYLTHAEVDFLKLMAQSLRKKPYVINIGAGGGTSGLAFMEARPDLRLTTIDITLADSPLGCLYAERVMLEEAGLADPTRWGQIHGDSKAVGRDWTIPVDMVFIDGDHTYVGCCGDIQNWLPHLRPGGLIAVHDYKKVDAFIAFQKARGYEVEITQALIGDYIKPYPDVDRAVDDLLLPRYRHLRTVDTLIAFRKQENGKP